MALLGHNELTLRKPTASLCTTTPKFRLISEKLVQTLDLQKPSHILPSWPCYEVSIVSIWEKIYHLIMAPYCMVVNRGTFDFMVYDMLKQPTFNVKITRFEISPTPWWTTQRSFWVWSLPMRDDVTIRVANRYMIQSRARCDTIFLLPIFSPPCVKILSWYLHSLNNIFTYTHTLNQGNMLGIYHLWLLECCYIVFILPIFGNGLIILSLHSEK